MPSKPGAAYTRREQWYLAGVSLFAGWRAWPVTGGGWTSCRWAQANLTVRRHSGCSSLAVAVRPQGIFDDSESD